MQVQRIWRLDLEITQFVSISPSLRTILPSIFQGIIEIYIWQMGISDKAMQHLVPVLENNAVSFYIEDEGFFLIQNFCFAIGTAESECLEKSDH